MSAQTFRKWSRQQATHCAAGSHSRPVVRARGSHKSSINIDSIGPTRLTALI